MIFRPKYFVVALGVLSLALTSLLAVAQLTTLNGVKTPLRAIGIPGARSVDEPMNRVIVKLKDTGSEKSLAAPNVPLKDRFKALGHNKTNSRLGSNSIELKYLKSITTQTHVALVDRYLKRSELSALVALLREDPSVEYAEIDEKIYPLFVPGDADYAGKQWNLKSPGADGEIGGANLPGAWNRFVSGATPVNGSGVVVAVLDSGYRPHADLASNLLAGYDFISADLNGSFTTANDGNGRDNDATDPGDWHATSTADCPVDNSSWHGTHVAGIIAAVSNANGIIGGAYGAKVLPVRVLGVCGGYTSDIAAGIRWAAGLPVSLVPNNPTPAKVINLSLGSPGTCSATFQSAITAATSVPGPGAVIVAATGNDGALAIGQPANCNGVLAVTAHTRLGDSAGYAAVGPGTTISAPGGGYGTNIPGDGSPIYSTSNAGLNSPTADNYSNKAGTSMAAPHVSAVAALLYQVKPGITPDEVQLRLINSARPHPASTYCFGSSACGAGLLDADAAVALTQDTTAPTSTATSSPSNPAPRGTTVNLTGSGTVNLPNTIVSSAWTQLSGPTVTIVGPNSANASFTTSSGVASYVFQYRATDNVGRHSDSWVTVRNVNTAPNLVTVPSQTIEIGRTLNFTATATDTDNDPVTFAISGRPSGASFNTNTGVFSWPNAQPVGTYTLAISPSDGAAYGFAQTVTITVSGPSSSGGGAADWWDLAALAAIALLGVRFDRKRTNAT